LVTSQSQSCRDSVEREDDDERQEKKTEWRGKRRVSEAKLFLSTDRLLFQKTWKSQDKTRELKLSAPQSTDELYPSIPPQYSALLRSCRRAGQTQISA
jgi:hypothetical protein